MTVTPKPAICLNCNRPLERKVHYRGDQIIDVVYSHAPDPRGDCPKMEPIPYDYENPPWYIVICDFCGAMGVEWDYDAESFSAFMGNDAEGRRHSFESVGKWGACGACHEDIEAKRWENVADRHILQTPEAAPHRNRLISYFKAFDAHRKGPAVPTQQTAS